MGGQVTGWVTGKGGNKANLSLIVGEQCNVDACANILALFMIMLCPWLCVHMYCSHCLWLYICLSSLTDHGTPQTQTHRQTHTHTHTHTHHTNIRVKCWAQVPRLKRKEWPLRPCQQWTARTPPPDHSSLPQPKLSIQLKLSQLGLQLAAWAFGWAWQLVN